MREYCERALCGLLRCDREWAVHFRPYESGLRLCDVLHVGLRERSLLLFDPLGCHVRCDSILSLRRHARHLRFGDQR